MIRRHGHMIARWILIILALAVGFLAGWRAHISTTEVLIYPNPMRPPVPDDLSHDVYLEQLAAIVEREWDA